MGIVLHEAEPTRRLGEAVQTHHQTLDLAGLGEELVDLLFGCVEGEVADVEGCGVGEGVDLGLGGFFVAVVAAAASLVLVGC